MPTIVALKYMLNLVTCNKYDLHTLIFYIFKLKILSKSNLQTNKFVNKYHANIYNVTSFILDICYVNPGISTYF